MALADFHSYLGRSTTGIINLWEGLGKVLLETVGSEVLKIQTNATSKSPLVREASSTFSGYERKFFLPEQGVYRITDPKFKYSITSIFL